MGERRGLDRAARWPPAFPSPFPEPLLSYSAPSWHLSAAPLHSHISLLVSHAVSAPSCALG